MFTPRQAACLTAVIYFVGLLLFSPVSGLVSSSLLAAISATALYFAALNLALLSQSLEHMTTLEAYLYLKYGVGDPR